MVDRLPRVLVVEDDVDSRRTINRALGSDFDVVEATSGAQAIQHAESGGFDVVVQSADLEEADDALTGMRLVYRIHGLLPQVPKCVVSIGDLTEVYETGLFRGLPKPFTPQALRGVVADLAENHPVTSREAAPAIPPARPWWMALTGVVVFVSSLFLEWKADAPDSVWISMLVLGALLIWVGPAPLDVWSAILKVFKK